MNAAQPNPAWLANQQPASWWRTCDIGDTWTIEPWEMSRSEVCRRAHQQKVRCGRVFKIAAVVDRRRNGLRGTRLESATVVTRIA